MKRSAIVIAILALALTAAVAVYAFGPETPEPDAPPPSEVSRLVEIDQPGS